MEKLKTIREIKKESYYGMRSAIALEATVAKTDVNNVLDKKTKNKILIHQVRIAATILLKKRKDFLAQKK